MDDKTQKHPSAMITRFETDFVHFAIQLKKKMEGHNYLTCFSVSSCCNKHSPNLLALSMTFPTVYGKKEYQL